jgi:2-polyprenyl-3-methyl-5-hydroxy-6-metoxy-1,4-benzoquinol methylase
MSNDAVDAYDRLAPAWAEVFGRRTRYLSAIDRLIIGEIPRGSASLLDVGAGDGVRATRIAAGAGLRRIVLLEPSQGMRARYSGPAEIWAARAEELARYEEQFDVITCLWNVLGHVPSPAARGEVLRQMRRLLSPQGIIFIDVNHRYNARQYGIAATAARIARDFVLPAPRNSDVRVRWNAGGQRIETIGHVFTHREIAALAGEAGLRIIRRFVVDYETGELRSRGFAGNLLYAMRQDDRTSDS